MPESYFNLKKNISQHILSRMQVEIYTLTHHCENVEIQRQRENIKSMKKNDSSHIREHQ